MGILFVMPVWAAPSELWMQRMIEAMEPHIAAIASRPPMPDSWRGRIPAVRLADEVPLWRRAARRAGLPIAQRASHTAAMKLRAVARRSAVSCMLVHYLEFALEHEAVWADVAKPLFVHCHGYDVTWDLRHADEPERRYFPDEYVASVRRLSERATLIANSRHTVAKLTAIGIHPARIRLKYLGVPVPPTCPDRRANGAHVEILYLGRLVDFKGPDLVLRSFELACSRGLDGNLTLAGDGPLRAVCERLRRQSTVADRIRLLGAVDAETGQRLRETSDLFVAHNGPGRWTRQEEALGVGVLEAMAAGLPVVTGRNGGVEETVVDGESGLLVPPGDIEAHAEAMLRLAADPVRRLRMGDCAWRRVRDHFSCDQERRTLIDILGLEASPNVRS